MKKRLRKWSGKRLWAAAERGLALAWGRLARTPHRPGRVPRFCLLLEALESRLAPAALNDQLSAILLQPNDGLANGSPVLIQPYNLLSTSSSSDVSSGTS